jgi:uncharacterized membrane protein
LSDDSKDARSYRISSLDVIRGLAIVVTALDHVRDFFLAGAVPDPMTDPDISTRLFATRWITHLCAPVFVFLAGVSAGLMLARKRKEQLSGFLVTRDHHQAHCRHRITTTALPATVAALLGCPGWTSAAPTL